MIDNRLEVFNLPDGGKEARVKLYDERDGLSDGEQKLIDRTVENLIDGGQELGLELTGLDSRALVVRSAISQWIKATKKITDKTG